MRREFRVYINIRPKGKHPSEITEVRTEHYDTYTEYVEAIRLLILEAIETELEGLDEADKLIGL